MKLRELSEVNQLEAKLRGWKNLRFALRQGLTPMISFDQGQRAGEGYASQVLERDKAEILIEQMIGQYQGILRQRFGVEDE